MLPLMWTNTNRLWRLKMPNEETPDKTPEQWIEDFMDGCPIYVYADPDDLDYTQKLIKALSFVQIWAGFVALIADELTLNPDQQELFDHLKKATKEATDLLWDGETVFVANINSHPNFLEREK